VTFSSDLSLNQHVHHVANFFISLAFNGFAGYGASICLN